MVLGVAYSKYSIISYINVDKQIAAKHAFHFSLFEASQIIVRCAR